MKRPMNVKILICAIVLLGAVSPIWANLIVSAGSVTALAGSSGNAIDIELTNTGPSPVTIGAFSLEVLLGGVAITWDSVSTATAVSYIFDGHSTFGPAIGTTASGQLADASDLFDRPLAGASLAAGQTAGLGRFQFTVAPSTLPGVFPVTVATFPSSSLSDEQGNDLAIDVFQAGQINILPPPATVPEPASIVLSGAAFLALALKKIGAGKKSRKN